MVYIIAMEGIQDNERRRLLETAKIPIEDAQAITNLALFGVQLSPGQIITKSKSKDRVSVNYITFFKTVDDFLFLMLCFFTSIGKIYLLGKPQVRQEAKEEAK